MRSFFNLRLIITSILFLITNIAFANAVSPVGYWQTIDDASGKAKSIVQITELPNHTLQGKVVKIYSNPNRLCEACSGEKKNKPILGMTIMQGLTQEPKIATLWDGGRILDPKNGKIYRCNIRLGDNGATLEVRGYLGMSLFGRSQTWKSIPSSSI